MVERTPSCCYSAASSNQRAVSKQPSPSRKHIYDTVVDDTVGLHAPTSSSVRKSMMPVLWPLESRNSPPKKGMKRFGRDIADMIAPYLVSLKCRSGSCKSKTT